MLAITQIIKLKKLLKCQKINKNCKQDKTCFTLNHIVLHVTCFNWDTQIKIVMVRGDGIIEAILYKTAIYCRLSLDDGSLGESGSIQTQKMMLEKYCRDNNFTIKEVVEVMLI